MTRRSIASTSRISTAACAQALCAVSLEDGSRLWSCHLLGPHDAVWSIALSQRCVIAYPSSTRLSDVADVVNMPVILRRRENGELVQRFVIPTTIADVTFKVDPRRPAGDVPRSVGPGLEGRQPVSGLRAAQVSTPGACGCAAPVRNAAPLRERIDRSTECLIPQFCFTDRFTARKPEVPELADAAEFNGREHCACQGHRPTNDRRPAPSGRTPHFLPRRYPLGFRSLPAKVTENLAKPGFCQFCQCPRAETPILAEEVLSVLSVPQRRASKNSRRPGGNSVGFVSACEGKRRDFQGYPRQGPAAPPSSQSDARQPPGYTLTVSPEEWMLVCLFRILPAVFVAWRGILAVTGCTEVFPRVSRCEFLLALLEGTDKTDGTPHWEG